MTREDGLKGLRAARQVAALEREILSCRTGPEPGQLLEEIRLQIARNELGYLRSSQGRRPVVSERQAQLELRVRELEQLCEAAGRRQAAEKSRQAALWEQYRELQDIPTPAELRQAYRERAQRLREERPELAGAGESQGQWISVVNGGLPSLGKHG